MSAPERFHMVRVVLDARKLFRLRARIGPAREAHDLDYAVHCALWEVFGKKTLSPFSVTGVGREKVEVLAYSSLSDVELLSRTAAALQDCVDRGSLKSKAMPDAFPEGARYEFRIRACPVIRKARGSRLLRPHAEVDVFLAQVERAGGRPVPDRRAVYCNWLKDQLGRSGAARCLVVRPVSMRLEPFFRRDRERRLVRLPRRPDVTFEGLLEVGDPRAFQLMVRRGIGRHRAFGFGMILLRTAG